MTEFFRGSTLIDSSVLAVFNFVANPNNLPEWVPFYNDVDPHFDRVPEKGDHFTATFSLVPPGWQRLPGAGLFGRSWPIRVEVDDVVHGRRIAYRAKEIAWTTVCDFEPMAGKAVVTVSHSLWSMQGLMANLWLEPLRGTIGDLHRRVMDGLKRRLEGRRVDMEPAIFFSYRRADAPYVAGRIFDALTAEFGLGTVFRDADSLVGGRDWASDVTEAVKRSRVIIAHIGDTWETELLKRAASGASDGLRDELEAGLENQAVPLIPVITSAQPTVTAHDRLVQIEKAIRNSPLTPLAPRICEKIRPALQAHRLRPDPDFLTDLERLMRSVWYVFHAHPAGAETDSISST